MIQPIVQQQVVNPVIQDTVIQPVVQAEVVRPVITETVVQPILQQEVVRPVITETVVQPVLQQEVVRPVITETVVSFYKVPVITGYFDRWSNRFCSKRSSDRSLLKQWSSLFFSRK